VDFHEILKHVDAIFQLQFLPFGKSKVSIYMILYTGVLFTILVLVTNSFKNWIERALQAHTSTDANLRQGISSIARYVLIFFGSLIILQTAGIDLSSFTVLAGALGLGVSFGLQTVTTNLVSGLIILFERPIKIGDRIEVDGVTGAAVILAAANGHPGVLHEPAADVIFVEFGQTALNFSLRVYTEEYLTRPALLRSEINFAVHKALNEHGFGLAYSSVIRANVAMTS